ncbi:hypothetical protein OLO84_05220 [Campylobacter jejuni]|nr:hypothetical protein [Campylobacter jejuni]MCW1320585.1 hypothetical protein [Campylobacter jejuni]
MQKANISENELTFKEIKGKEVLYHQKAIKGLQSQEILGEMINKFLKVLVLAKVCAGVQILLNSSVRSVL